MVGAAGAFSGLRALGHTNMTRKPGHAVESAAADGNSCHCSRATRCQAFFCSLFTVAASAGAGAAVTPAADVNTSATTAAVSMAVLQLHQ